MRQFYRAGVALLALGWAQAGAAQTSAEAQDNQSQAEAIVVTGVRASLDSALSEKRKSTEFVDALVAEDFAKFPDANLAEALQRIPGITVERRTGGDLGSAVGEGGSINLRGLEANFTRTQVNGLNLTNPGTERGFSFNVLASELIASTVVHKTLTAQDDEGGLAGTVNLNIYHPLDYKDRVLSATVRANYTDQAEKVNPSVTLIYADQFADNRLGVAVGFNYDYRNIVENRQGHGWTPLINSMGKNASTLTAAQLAIAQSTLIPLDPAVFINDQARRRINATLSLQAEPSDDLRLSFDNIYARLTSEGENIRLDFPIEGAPATRIPVDLVRDGDIFRSGTFPASSQFMRIIDNRISRRQELYQGVLSAEWRPASNLTVSPKLAYSNAVEDFSRWNQLDLRSAFTNIRYTFDGEGVTADPAIGDKLDPGLYTELNRIRDRPSYDKDREFSGKLDVEWKFDLGPITALAFGGGYSDRKKSFRAYDGRAAGFPNSTTVTNLDDYLRYRPLDMTGGAPMVAPGVLEIVNRDTLIATAAPNGYEIPEILGSRYDITEKVKYGYVMARFELGGLSGNAGVRVVGTRQTAVGFQTLAAVLQPASFTHDYTFALPSLQLRYEVTDKLLARASIYRSLTRPNLADIQPGRRLDTFNGGTGTAGNPDLQPFTAYNYDAGLEWYFQPESLVSVTYFRKELSGFVERLTDQVTFTDVATGQPYMIFLTRPVNGEPATIQGLEFSFQTPFRFLPGLLKNTGILANLTYTTASGQFADGDSRNKAFPYLSKYSYNLIGYYDSGPVSIRLAYAWRDRYAIGFVGSGGLANSREPYGQLDFSSSFKLNEAFSVKLDVQNLLDRHDITSVDLRPELQSGVAQIGRRFSIGATYRF